MKISLQLSRNTLVYAALCSILCIQTACKKEDTSCYDEANVIGTYVADNNITVKPSNSGLYYIETLAGDGTKAEWGNTVYVHYTGYLLDGTEFDSSIGGDPLSFALGYRQVISGWEEGIYNMKERGKARLIIPSSLAYGVWGRSGIPPCATLIFDVELIQVE